MLSVTPVDGEWGQLRYFRTLGGSQEAGLVIGIALVVGGVVYGIVANRE